MRGADSFSDCHPAVNFFYFGLVLTFSMVLTHPVALSVSLVCSICYGVFLHRGLRPLRFLLPVMLLAAILNPAFSHEGATILAYFPSGNPLTLESIAYGAAAGAILGAALGWFSCLNRVLTSDKFLYLFGRVSPGLSLALSMTLRFVPRFSAHLRAVSETRSHDGRLPSRLRAALSAFSATVTWSLENAVDTADSMNGRGYGLPGRTSFSLYRFGQRDKLLLLWLAAAGCFVGVGAACGALRWRYYPTLNGMPPSFFGICVLAVYLALCLTPMLLDWKEERIWKSLKF